MIRIEIEIENAAFADNYVGAIRAVMLQAEQIIVHADGGTVRTLRDSNGNTVGKVTVE